MCKSNINMIDSTLGHDVQHIPTLPLQNKTFYQTHHQRCANRRWAENDSYEAPWRCTCLAGPLRGFYGTAVSSECGDAIGSGVATWPHRKRGHDTGGRPLGRRCAPGRRKECTVGAPSRAVPHTLPMLMDEHARTVQTGQHGKDPLMLVRGGRRPIPISRGGRRLRERQATVGPLSHRSPSKPSRMIRPTKQR